MNPSRSKGQRATVYVFSGTRRRLSNDRRRHPDDNDDYVQSHEDEARSLIRAMIDATHFFKTKKADTVAIIKMHCTELLKMQNDEEWDCFYDTQAASLEAKPYPTLDAIQNVFALALKRDPEIKNFNPLALWDLHYLREIDDSGYTNRLYG